MIKLSDNVWFDPTTGIIIERDMYTKTHSIIKSIHNIPKLDVATGPEVVTDMIVLDLERASGKVQPRIEDRPPPKPFNVGKREETK